MELIRNKFGRSPAISRQIQIGRHVCAHRSGSPHDPACASSQSKVDKLKTKICPKSFRILGILLSLGKRRTLRQR
jgi:hypothetical protein